ncbi:hypothetical protein BJY04DRAFT_221634 [Aspergillus karnatakaensis]|uniref:uncharacterized protein n=1 Tax=Aspergillus karnatakaensis TaxID=1810916 RepID=UPI003CCCCC12
MTPHKILNTFTCTPSDSNASTTQAPTFSYITTSSSAELKAAQEAAQEAEKAFARKCLRLQTQERVAHLNKVLREGTLAAGEGQSFAELIDVGIEVQPMNVYCNECSLDPMVGVSDNYFAPMAPGQLASMPIQTWDGKATDAGSDSDSDEEDAEVYDALYETIDEAEEEEAAEDKSLYDMLYEAINEAEEKSPRQRLKDRLDEEEAVETLEEKRLFDALYKVMNKVSGTEKLGKLQSIVNDLEQRCITHKSESAPEAESNPSPQTTGTGIWDQGTDGRSPSTNATTATPITPQPVVYSVDYHTVVSSRIQSSFVRCDRVWSAKNKQLTTLINETAWYDRRKEARLENVFGRYSEDEAEIYVPTAYHPDDSWFVRAIYSSQDNVPHTSFIVSSQPHATADPAKTLMRSEVITILTAMISRYQNGRPVMKKNKVMPVSLISIIGHRARILQAHFNGEYVVIRMFPLIDPETVSEENGYDLFSRYLASTPIGDTTVFPGTVYDDLNLDRFWSTHSPSENQASESKKRSRSHDEAEAEAEAETASTPSNTKKRKVDGRAESIELGDSPRWKVPGALNNVDVDVNATGSVELGDSPIMKRKKRSADEAGLDEGVPATPTPTPTPMPAKRTKISISSLPNTIIKEESEPPAPIKEEPKSSASPSPGPRGQKRSAAGAGLENVEDQRNVFARLMHEEEEQGGEERFWVYQEMRRWAEEVLPIRVLGGYFS